MASNAANDDVDDRLGVQKQQGQVEEATAAAAAPSAVATALGYSGPKVTATSPAGVREKKTGTDVMSVWKDDDDTFQQMSRGQFLFLSTSLSLSFPTVPAEASPEGADDPDEGSSRVRDGRQEHVGGERPHTVGRTEQNTRGP